MVEVQQSADEVVEGAVPELPPDVFPVVIGERVLYMSLSYRDLCEGEFAHSWKYPDANLLLVLPNPFTLRSMRIIFAVSLYKRHPEIPFEEAKALLTIGYVFRVATIFARVWNRSVGLKDAPVDAAADGGQADDAVIPDAVEGVVAAEPDATTTASKPRRIRRKRVG